MKNLLLMRHATAADKAFGQIDFDREITLLGERQAGEAGQWLKAQNLLPELILCSPATRTRMTLENMMSEMHHRVPIQMERTIYYGSESDLQDLLHGVAEDVDTLLVVGHNPTIAFFASALAHQDIDFQTATIVHLQFNGYSWENLRAGTCKLQAIFNE